MPLTFNKGVQPFATSEFPLAIYPETESVTFVILSINPFVNSKLYSRLLVKSETTSSEDEKLTEVVTTVFAAVIKLTPSG